jgi:hypothetical protein
VGSAEELIARLRDDIAKEYFHPAGDACFDYHMEGDLIMTEIRPRLESDNGYDCAMHALHMGMLADAAAISKMLAEDEDPVAVDPELIIRILNTAEKEDLIEWRSLPD